MNEMMIQTMNFGVPMIYMWLLMILAIALYFMPTIVAGYRHHNSLMLIMVLNILLGWTMLGWLGLLIWACFGGISTPPGLVRQKRNARTAPNTSKQKPSNVSTADLI